MPGAHDAIPIYLYLLTPATYLPTYLIIPSGPLEAISDLHTERCDGFTARLCATSIYPTSSSSPPARAASRRVRVDFAPFCSYFRKSEGRLANSGIAVRRIFSLLLFALARSLTGIVALCSPRGTRAEPSRLLSTLCRHVRRFFFDPSLASSSTTPPPSFWPRLGLIQGDQDVSQAYIAHARRPMRADRIASLNTPREIHRSILTFCNEDTAGSLY